MIWDRFRGPGWREELLPDYRAGKTSALEVMIAGYRPLSQPAQEMLDYVRPQVQVREGFAGLQQLCCSQNWPLRVVSQGLDWYIRAFVPPEIHCYSFIAELNGHWQVKLPAGVELRRDQDFKFHVLAQLKREHAGLPITFIGDGRNDFPIARQADRVFAVKGSSLSRLCREAAVACAEFTSFDEVTRVLRNSAAR
mgnify:CR=1 FL=1